jgi:hypothetical protein
MGEIDNFDIFEWFIAHGPFLFQYFRFFRPLEPLGDSPDVKIPPHRQNCIFQLEAYAFN